jgi:hypothetical protein
VEKRIEIFCCYARRDQSHLLELKVHLAPLERAGLITLWADIDIDAGIEWEKEIHRHLNTAHIILFLISPDFMASEYCYGVEMRQAIERHKRGNMHVIPIILRPTYWYEAPFGKLQVLPTFAKPIISNEWRYPDEAFLDVVTEIRKIVEKLRLGPPRVSSITERAAAIREQMDEYIPHIPLDGGDTFADWDKS